jgi:undecaprenyl-diphosphatase
MLGLSVYDFLMGLDLAILRFFNSTLGSPWMDHFWLFITQMHKYKIISFVIAPVLIGWVVYIYRWEAVKLLVALGLAIALADSIAYRGIKQIYERPRPFQNSATSAWLRKSGSAHGPSFPSNHAANCFAAAVVLSWYFRRYRYVFYTLAATVAISRLMLGVHYPSDVLAGAILGICVGWLVTTEMAKRMRVSKKRKQDRDWRSLARRRTSG